MHRIHIFGASGAGTTTLGRELSKRINGKHLDTDSYYWRKTDPPFSSKREPSDRVTTIQRDVEGVENWVLSGSICSWGDPLLDRFTIAVFLELDPSIRIERITRRERERYGARIHPDGDMYQQHIKFLDWARSYDHAKAPARSFDLHEKWMQSLNCPIIRLNSNATVAELCDEVLNQAMKRTS